MLLFVLFIVFFFSFSVKLIFSHGHSRFFPDRYTMSDLCLLVYLINTSCYTGTHTVVYFVNLRCIFGAVSGVRGHLRCAPVPAGDHHRPVHSGGRHHLLEETLPTGRR